tara:strand:- start:776 stop:910 length:135 start_codon:yes stop_codon:yes gene_type:complete
MDTPQVEQTIDETDNSESDNNFDEEVMATIYGESIFDWVNDFSR